MLHRLLIALFALTLLSACGSSSSDDPAGNGNGNGGAENGNGNGGENGNGNGTGDGITIAGPRPDGDGNISVCFGNPEDIESWQAFDIFSAGSNATLSHNAGEQALEVMPEWHNGQLYLNTPIDGAIDITGRAVTADVWVHEDYADLRFQWVVADATEQHEGRWGGELDPGDWTTIELAVAEDATELDGWGNNVDLTQVERIGLWLQHRDGDHDQLPNESILIGCLSMHTGSGEEDEPELNATEISLDSGWRAHSDYFAFEYVPEGVTYSPIQEDHQLLYFLNGPANLAGHVLEIEFQVDQAFIDSGASIELLVQERNTWSGSFCSVSQALEAQVPVVATCAIADDEHLSPASGEQTQLGIQTKGSPEGSVLLLDVTVRDPMQENAPIDVPLDSGWITYSSLPFSYTPEGVIYHPGGDFHHLTYELVGPADVAGRALEMELQVDQAFIDSGATIELLAQSVASIVQLAQAEDDREGSFCAITHTLEAQVPVVATCDITDSERLSPASGEHIQLGVRTRGAAQGSVLLREVTLRDRPPAIEVPLDSGWRSQLNTGTLEYVPEGVTYAPTEEDHQLLYDLSGPADVAGRVLETALQVDQAFIDSGASIELLIQEKDGWEGSFCSVTQTLEAQVPVVATCGITDNELLSPVFGEQIQLGIQTKGSPAGSVVLLEVTIR